MLPRDGVVNRPDLQLHYYVVGEGPPLIILSGGPGFDVRYMDPVAQLLADSHSCVMLEQRGTGQSTLTRLDESTLNLSRYMTDLEGLRTHLGLEQLDLLGHSWGGLLAMAYAVAHPGRVRKMILVGSCGPTMEFMAGFRNRVAAKMTPEDEQKAALARSNPNSAIASVEYMRAIAHCYFHSRESSAHFKQILQPGVLTPGTTQIVFSQLDSCWDIRDSLRELDIPTLILHGEEDPIPVETAKELHALISGSKLRLFPACGHFPWIEATSDFTSSVQEFLD